MSTTTPPTTPAATTTQPAAAPTPETSNQMNEEQAEILATLIHSMRPDWGKQGIIKHLGMLHATMDAITLTLGAMHAAADPTYRSPAILMHPGKHWDRARGIGAPAKPAGPQRATGVDTSPMCKQHPELHEWECKTCKRATPPPPNFKEMVQQATEQARKAMNAALDTVHEAANTTQDDLELAAPAGA